MLNQVTIANVIRQAKFHTSTLLERITDKILYGDKNPIEQKQLIVLTKYIEILEDYLVDNFDQEGVITAVSECLTADQINECVAKTKLIIGNKRYPVPTWLLAEGYWNDASSWSDSDVWRDTPYFQ